MKGVILAGGTGSRLEPLTCVVNKHLLPIYDKPMICYPISTLASMKIEDILIIVGGNSVGDFINFLGDGKDFGVDITYRYQNEPLGIAHGVSLAKKFVGNDKFAVILGDNIFEEIFNDRRALFELSDLESILFLHEVNNPERFGVPVFAEDNKTLLKIEEKPKQPKSNFAVTGLYFYSPVVFDIIPNLQVSNRNEYEITDLNNILISRGKTIYSEVGLDWTDAGTFESLYNANKIIHERTTYANSRTNN